MTRAKGKKMTTKQSKFNPASVPTSPVADSPHKRPANTDPRVDGPYLDDVRLEQENAYRDFRNMSESKRKAHNRNVAAAGTVVDRPENNPNVRDLTDAEKKALGEYNSNTPKKKASKKTSKKPPLKTAASTRTRKRTATKKVK